MKLEIDTNKDRTKAFTDGILIALDKRKELWAKLSLEKKQDWQERKVDPVIYETYQLYLKLKEFYG